MKKSILLFLVLISAYCFAQPEWEWVYDVHHIDHDLVYELALDDYGNTYSLVRFYNDSLVIGTDTISAEDSGLLTGFLLKLDSEGNFQWTRQITSDTQIFCRTLCVDEENNIYVGGKFNNSVYIEDITLYSSPGTSGLFVAKYDNEGNLVNAFSYPDTNGAEIRHMCISRSNEIVVCGEYRSSFNLGGFEMSLDAITPNYDNIFVAKIDYSGNVIWADYIDGENQEVSSDISCDRFGNVYLLGQFLTEEVYVGDFTLYNSVLGNVTNDILLVKYNSLGEVSWAEKIGGDAQEFGRGICVDNENNIFAVGTFSGSEFIFNDSIMVGGGACNSTFIIKFDSMFNRLWGKTFGSMPNNEAKCIAVDPSGNPLVAGTFASFINIDGFSIDASGYPDMYVVKLSKDGEVLDLADSGGNFYETPMDIESHSNESCIVAGYFVGTTLELGDLIIYNDSSPNQDLFIAKLNTHSTTNISKNQINISIFPNPATQSFSIDVDSPESTIEIFDTNGKTVKKITTYNSEQIPVSDLSKGIYFVKMISGGKISVGKLVVE